MFKFSDVSTSVILRDIKEPSKYIKQNIYINKNTKNKIEELIMELLNIRNNILLNPKPFKLIYNELKAQKISIKKYQKKFKKILNKFDQNFIKNTIIVNYKNINYCIHNKNNKLLSSCPWFKKMYTMNGDKKYIKIIDQIPSNIDQLKLLSNKINNKWCEGLCNIKSGNNQYKRCDIKKLIESIANC